MSDNDENTAPAEHDCGNPNCALGKLLKTKIRAVTVDGETYIHPGDAAHWLGHFADIDAAGVLKAADHIPAEVAEGLRAAAHNSRGGSAQTEQRLASLAVTPIKPADDPEAILVDPADLIGEVPDTFPADWLTETAPSEREEQAG